MQAILYGFYFEREQTVLRLPVNPEGYTLTQDTDNGSYNVVGIGPIVIPRRPNLQTISFDGFLPKSADAPYVLTSGGFLPPKSYIDFFLSALSDRAILRFIISRYTETGSPVFDTNLPVVVSSFSYEEKGGQTGDFFYSISLTEYKDYSPQQVQIVEQATSTAPAVATTEQERDVPQGQIVVGSSVIVNGSYYYSSYGDEPHGTFSGFQGVVSRIVTTDPTRAYPIHITTPSGGAKGWVKESQCQVVGSS